jgi:hypothetical protein
MAILHQAKGWVGQRQAEMDRSRHAFLSRRALVTTDTELKLMATAAIMGESRRRVKGYSAPAAIGTPTAL